MLTHNHQTVRTTTQRREQKKAQQPISAARSYRSLNLEPGHHRALRFQFAPLRLCLNSLLIIVIVALSTATVLSQEVEDTIKIKTRVVFLDALVKDKKTNLPVSNLPQENFEVLDNGKPRPIAYFSREGDPRKPLALILILDLREDGAGRFMKRPEVIKSMEEALAKLPPGDEVAIMAMDLGEEERGLWISEFTNDRTKFAGALARVQRFAEGHEEEFRKEATIQKRSAEAEDSLTNDVVSTEVTIGKDGSTVTRQTLRDGSVNLKRTNKDGSVTIELGNVYDMSAAVSEASRKAAAMRPNSQVSLVWVSDGIAPIFFEDRDVTEQVLIRDNVTFNSLTVDLRTLFKFLMPIGKPIAGWVGVSLYGSAKYLAERTGGEALKAGKPKDYVTALQRIIGNITARYSLGFALAEDEVDDGQMHSLEVRVKAKDEKGKSRKLLVTSRQGYYMSSVGPKSAVTSAR